jgi:sugar phosphate isomerase/epimerase
VNRRHLLASAGTHTTISPASLDAEMDIAQTLGMAHIGTGGDPSGSAYQADWDRAADDWNAMSARAQARGLKLYIHNHDTAYDFLLDAGPFDAAGRPTRAGYSETPLGEGDINFQQFFQTIGLPDYHHANSEMDDAQLGGPSDPGKSLRIAELSYDNMSALTTYVS